ncbi:hypothetical protein FRC02_012179 [Tulasnella sp. 418]|nr:hypothetical protein FRC02_012179 [Tulasnella sp. 418]
MAGTTRGVDGLERAPFIRNSDSPTRRSSEDEDDEDDLTVYDSREGLSNVGQGSYLPMSMDDSKNFKPSWSTRLNLFVSRRKANWKALTVIALGVLIIGYGLWRAGSATTELPPPSHTDDNELWQKRAELVKNEFLQSYRAYEKYAFPKDELRPYAKEGINNYNGWGVTVFDALDSLLLMDCKEEYERAVKHISTVDFHHAVTYIPFFETTIRYLGGLLSAFAMTNNTILLERADELGTILLPSFNTPKGLPVLAIDATTGEHHNRQPDETAIPEIGTCQLEFKMLAHLTGNKLYFEKVDRMTDLLRDTQSPASGMWGNMWDTQTGRQNNDHLAVGGAADSAYEYLLKSYLQGAKTEPKIRDVYIKAVNGIIENLLYLSPTRKLLYVTDVSSFSRGNDPSGKLEHLSCFLPGTIILGVKYLKGEPGVTNEMIELWQWAAEGLARTCWLTYADQPSGLAPYEVQFSIWKGGAKKGRWLDHVNLWKRNGRPGSKYPPGVVESEPFAGKIESKDYVIRFNHYQLRPETIDSLYMLWKVTGDPVWRERGWSIWESVMKHCKIESGGYSSVYGINVENPTVDDGMPSWFLAETMKYIYLLASPREDLVPLDSWVFNTEAHPLPIIHWSKTERALFNMSMTT